MIRSIMIAAIVALPTVTAAESNLDADVRAMCKADFPNDFSTQKYCIDQAKNGATKFAETVGRLGKENPQAAMCYEDFYPDMNTANYCLDRHIEAGEKLVAWRGTATGDRAIVMTGCAGDFPVDLSTQAYCVQQQFKAIDELNN